MKSLTITLLMQAIAFATACKNEPKASKASGMAVNQYGTKVRTTYYELEGTGAESDVLKNGTVNQYNCAAAAVVHRETCTTKIGSAPVADFRTRLVEAAKAYYTFDAKDNEELDKFLQLLLKDVTASPEQLTEVMRTKIIPFMAIAIGSDSDPNTVTMAQGESATTEPCKPLADSLGCANITALPGNMVEVVVELASPQKRPGFRTHLSTKDEGACPFEIASLTAGQGFPLPRVQLLAQATKTGESVWQARRQNQFRLQRLFAVLQDRTGQERPDNDSTPALNAPQTTDTSTSTANGEQTDTETSRAETESTHTSPSTSVTTCRLDIMP